MNRLVAACAVALTAGLGCTDRVVMPPGMGIDGVALELVASGFSQPLLVTTPPGDNDRLFVVERGGLIHIVVGGETRPTPFLDLSQEVGASGGEQGLLGMAFHPLFSVNGWFFVSYTDTRGHSRLARYGVSANPDVADAGSGTPFFDLPQPFTNHNGGHIAFGPDGMLYVGIGDGGSGGDPLGHGQDPTSLLGAMLRFDIDDALPGIPPDNPFVGSAAGADAVWAYGLRNPWRFSFDRQTGALYIGDVGQSTTEEINVQPAASHGGENYGWNVMEGLSCFQGGGCDQTGLTLPVLEYAHTAGACSVTGGYVYRGGGVPVLAGRYLYADFCSGFVRSFLFDGAAVSAPRDHTPDLETGSMPIASFGEDADGEIYIVAIDGRIFRIVSVS